MLMRGLQTKLGIAMVVSSLASACSGGGAASSPSQGAMRTSPATAITTSPTAAAVSSLDGTWRSEEVTCAQMTATLESAGISTKQMEATGNSCSNRNRTVFTIKTADGQLVLFSSQNGAQDQEEWSGPFMVVNDHTIVAGEPPCGPITYHYALEGDRLTIDVVKDECDEIGDLIAQTMIYETSPFTKVS